MPSTASLFGMTRPDIAGLMKQENGDTRFDESVDLSAATNL
jgi:hypothetical protein